MCLEIIYLMYIYKKDLEMNNDWYATKLNQTYKKYLSRTLISQATNIFQNIPPPALALKIVQCNLSLFITEIIALFWLRI